MRKKGVIIALALLATLITTVLPLSPVSAQETLIWSAEVSSKGVSVSSPVLSSGTQYRIVATGWFISCDITYGWVKQAIDAQYYTDEFYMTFNYGPVWSSPQPAPGGSSFLQINGISVNWGSFSNIDHQYSIYYTGTGAPITFTIVDLFDGEYTWNFCHIDVEIYEIPQPPRGETAYAYGGPYATCFLCMDFDGNGKGDFKNWGWSNGPLGPGIYNFDIYAGAAKCDLSKGDLVGTLTINYDGSTAVVTYVMNAGWIMYNTQLYVGPEPLPRDSKGEFTTAPGQYLLIHPGIMLGSDTYTVTGLSGDIYVVAHADVVEA